MDLEQVRVTFTGDLSELKAGLDRVTREAEKATSAISARFENLSKKTQDIGKKISLGLGTPIAGVMALAVRAFNEEAQAVARLEAAIRAAGDEVDTQIAQFKEYASLMQSVTTVADDVTLGNIQVARSMGLSAQQSARAAKNAVGLAKAFGINERSAIRYTAALEQGDTTMLNRYLPTLRNIESQSDRVAAAQRMLADAFATATAEAQKGLGPIQQLNNDIGDLLEQIGEIVLDGINPFVKDLRHLVLGLQQLSPEAKRTAVTIAGIAVAIGPALVAFGLLASLTGVALRSFVAFGKGVGKVVVFLARELAMLAAALFTPVGAAVAATGAILAAFLYFRRSFTVVLQGIVDVAELTLVKGFTNYVARPFIQLVNDMLARLPKKVTDFLGFESFEVPDEVKEKIPDAFADAMARAKEAIKSDLENMKADFAAFGDKVKSLLPEGLVSLFSADILKLGESAAATADNLDKLIASMSNVGGGLSAADEAAKKITDTLTVENEQLTRMIAAMGEMPQHIQNVRDQIELENAARQNGIDLQSEQGKLWAEEFRRNQELRRTLQQVEGVMADIATAQDRYQEEIRVINELLAKGVIDHEEYEKAIAKAKKRMEDADEKTNEMKDAVKELGLTFASAFEDAIVNGGKLSDILKGILKDIIRIIARKLVIEPTMKWISGSIPGVIGSANGNVFHGGHIKRMANGGVVSRPTVFPMANGGVGLMGEAGPEAVMPLQRTRSGKLGVLMVDGGRASARTIVHAPVNLDARGATAEAAAVFMQMAPMLEKRIKESVEQTISRGVPIR